jgi:hypothetical protein
MAFQAFPNGQGMLVGPFPSLPESAAPSNIGNLTAAGNRVGAIGYLLLSSGPGTSKTISSAGGKVYWTANAITFANAGSTLKVGVQDVAATGVEDTTFDVRADLVGGVDTITANAVNMATMTTGTKTIAHGDLIAVVLELSARGGTDSIGTMRSTGSSLPHCSFNGAKIASLPLMAIEFDDGTLGYFDVSAFPYVDDIPAAFSSSSTPDEYALIFRVPVTCVATGLYGRLSSLTASNDFEFILYSDPLGTPVAERTLVQDNDLIQTNVLYGRTFPTAYTLLANTDYAIALRPTTTNALSFKRINVGFGNVRNATMLSANWYQATRTNQTGAFGSADTIRLPLFGVWLGQFDNAVPASGGARSYGSIG